MTQFTYSAVIAGLKEGKCFRRPHWQPKMFIYLVDSSEFNVSRAPLDKFFYQGTHVKYNAHIDVCLIQEDGSISAGVFTPGVGDELANDWEVFDQPINAKTKNTSNEDEIALDTNGCVSVEEDFVNQLNDYSVEGIDYLRYSVQSIKNLEKILEFCKVSDREVISVWACPMIDNPWGGETPDAVRVEYKSPELQSNDSVFIDDLKESPVRYEQFCITVKV